MKNRRVWRRALIGAVLALGVLPLRSFAFVESTETQGELPTNISGVWLLVNHLEFTKGEASPSPGASPAPTPAPAKGAAANNVRYFTVANLVRIVHYPKGEADKMREADRKMEEASTERAKAIVAEEQKKEIPVQTESGEVQGESTVIVPSVPPKRQPGSGDDVDIFLLDVALPQPIQEAIDKAVKAEKAWTPTEKDLELLKSSLNDLKPSGRDEYSKIEWKVITKDKYEENYQIDPTTKDAKFLISANEEMIPKPNVPKTNVIVYGVEQTKGDVLSGKHTRAMMASAPFPIPIEMKGTFKMYKVADLPGEKAQTAAETTKPAAGQKAATKKKK